MSSRSLRRVLAGSLVAAFFSLSSPVSAEAADFVESPAVASFWVQAWQWLEAQILPPDETAAPATAATVEGVAASGSDAGWMLDPDG